MKEKKNYIYAGIMGILTLFFCLIIADGVIHMDSYYEDDPALPGKIVFSVSLIILPLLFMRHVQWKHTVINLPLYFLLYFVAYEICGDDLRHVFLEDPGGLLAIPPAFYAAVVMVLFWGVQSMVYLIYNIIRRIVIKCKKPKSE